MEGQIGTTPRRSIVFNTGQVLHGWIDLEQAGHPGYDESAARAARFLTDELGPDGIWNPSVQYSGLAHTYDSRVAWAMLRWAQRSGDESVGDAARRQLDWVCTRQRPNGWFDDCVFKTGTTPSTHALAYTLRGLLESHAITPSERWLDAVLRTSEVLIRKLEVLPRLVANYDEEWRAAASHSCLTGTVQLGGVWLRLYQVTGDARWLNAGLKAVEQGAARQETAHWPPIHGAIAGSFPLWGRYAPLQYPNWATKFLADSLMLYDELLDAASDEGDARLPLPAGRHPGLEAAGRLGAARGRHGRRDPLQPLVARRPGARGAARGGARRRAPLRGAAQRGRRPRSQRSQRRRAGRAGRRSRQSLADWAAQRGLAVHRFGRLGDADALAAVTASAPDLVLLTGSDIAPASLLAIPRVATINAHYGLLPRYRGMNVTEWSLFHGDPPGVSVHIVDPGIDTGDILLREEIPCPPGATLQSLRAAHQQTAARLLVDAALQLRDGSEQRTPQRADEGHQYYRMHPALRARVERALAQRALGPGAA